MSAPDLTRRADIVEDVTFLLDTGEWPENVARRCGYKNAETLSRVLYRWGYPELGRRLEVHAVAS